MGERFFAVRAVPWLFTALLAMECSLDERTLRHQPTPGVGGANGSSGTSSGKGGNAAKGGTSAGDHSGGTGTADGGESGDGSGGTSGSLQGGLGGSMAGSGNAAGSGGSAGSGGAGGSGGSGGKSMDIGNCADLDENGTRDCDETLVENSTFDSDASSWVEGDGADQIWSNDDARDRSASGSIEVTNTLHSTGPGSVAAATEQCIEVEGGATYQVRTRVFVDTDSSPGEPGLYLWFYDSTDCSGTLHFGSASGDRITRGDWQPFSVFAAAPAQSHSARVRLAAIKNFDDPNFEVFFDDVLAKAVEAE